MIVEFDHEKSTVTFGGARFVCSFTKSGLINKTFKVSIFEADANFQPLETTQPLFEGNMPDDEYKALNTIKIVLSLDSGRASWIPEKFLLVDRNSKYIKDFEDMMAQISFGKVIMLLENKEFFMAELHTSAVLLSGYFEENIRGKSRFLRKQSEACFGLNNYSQAKKSLLMAIEMYKDDSEYDDYFILGSLEFKLNEKIEAADNLKKFIKLADAQKDRDKIILSEKIISELV